MKYIRTTDGIYDVSIEKKKLLESLKKHIQDLIEIAKYNDDEDEAKLLKKELKSIKVSDSRHGETLVISAESERYDEGNEYVIVAESDRIEELCDEFIVFIEKEPNGKLLWFDSFEELKKQIIDNSELVIYGAIWTEKGLIYVAKMNEKGELELL